MACWPEITSSYLNRQNTVCKVCDYPEENEDMIASPKDSLLHWIQQLSRGEQVIVALQRALRRPHPVSCHLAPRLCPPPGLRGPDLRPGPIALRGPVSELRLLKHRPVNVVGRFRVHGYLLPLLAPFDPCVEQRAVLGNGVIERDVGVGHPLDILHQGNI